MYVTQKLALLFIYLGICFSLELQAAVIFNEEKCPMPEYLYKIVSIDDWSKSLEEKQVVRSPMDEEFIHLATEKQLSHVAKKFWSNRDYIVLELDVDKLSGRLEYETNPGGSTKYYHLYDGNIPVSAVVSTEKMTDPKK